MDVRCPICSEPWDIDSIHEAADELDSTFSKVRQDFARRGCVALGGRKCEPDNSLRSMASAAMFDMMGDDIDGNAAMMEDFEFLGMLD